MSSTYRLLCASHAPAIVIGDELTSADVEAIRSRDAIPRDHATCDIVAGRYSYPMVEVACFGRQLPGVTGCEGYHSGVIWTLSDWLRVLHAARRASVHVKHTNRFRCWPPERLGRLGSELGTGDP